MNTEEFSTEGDTIGVENSKWSNVSKSTYEVDLYKMGASAAKWSTTKLPHLLKTNQFQLDVELVSTSASHIMIGFIEAGVNLAEGIHLGQGASGWSYYCANGNRNNLCICN